MSFDYGLPLTLTDTEINQTGSLGLFNSDLGLLTGASIEVFGGAALTFGGTNSAVTATRANLTATTSLLWSTNLGNLTSFLSDTIDF